MRFTLVLFVLVLLAGAASAQPPKCGPRAQIESYLSGAKYGERPLLELGNNDGSNVMHLYGNTATGTWSLLVFPQPGIACLVMTGKSIEPMGGAALPENPS